MSQQTETRELTPDAQADRDAFESTFGTGNCSCHLSPPCNSCVHPGNPSNQDEDDNCWQPAQRGVVGAPERIVLCVGDAPDGTAFADLHEVTWCAESQNAADIGYVRSDLAAPPAPVGGAEWDIETVSNAFSTVRYVLGVPAAMAGTTPRQHWQEIVAAIAAWPLVGDALNRKRGEAAIRAQSAPLNEGGSEPIGHIHKDAMRRLLAGDTAAIRQKSYGDDGVAIYARPQPVAISEGGKGEGVQYAKTVDAPYAPISQPSARALALLHDLFGVHLLSGDLDFDFDGWFAIEDMHRVRALLAAEQPSEDKLDATRFVSFVGALVADANGEPLTEDQRRIRAAFQGKGKLTTDIVRKCIDAAIVKGAA